MILFLMSALISYAQVPESMNYQAVARNNAGVALANQTIQVRLTIKRANTTLYTETRTVTTNLLGLFNVQIGSPGVSSSSGSFTNINWLNNTPELILLQVELDLNNNNVFTNMGTQPFNSVPHALSAKNSIEVVNLAGRYIDPVTSPTIGARLSWNGTSWTPVKKDTSIYISSTGNTIVAGGANAPWVFLGAQYTFTSTGTESVSASFSSALGHAHSVFIPVQMGVCYQSLPSGDVTSFDLSTFEGISFGVPSNTIAPRYPVSAVGNIVLPAGNYRIGMCIKNITGNGLSLNNNGRLNGVIEIKY